MKKLFGFLFKTIMAFIAIVVVVAVAIGFALANAAAPTAPAAGFKAASTAPVVTPAVQWELTFTAGSPPLPAATALPQVQLAAQLAQLQGQLGTGQYLLTGVLDPCCTPAENWPVVLEVRPGGQLFATEYRGEKSYEESLVGYGVTRIIAASAGWRHENGYWHPILTVFYEDGNGAQVSEFNTRTMFGR